MRPIRPGEAARWDELVRTRHYLGLGQLVGESLKYVAEALDAQERDYRALGATDDPTPPTRDRGGGPDRGYAWAVRVVVLGEPAADIALRENVTRQAVSARVAEVRRAVGLPPSPST